MTIEAARVLVVGRVQGVGFRYACRLEAQRAGATGWVRNLANGHLEAIFEGEGDAVSRMIEWCRRGPPGARVARVSVETCALAGYREFEIRPTAED